MFFVVFAIAGLTLLLHSLIHPVASLIKGALILLFVLFLLSLFIPDDSTTHPVPSEQDGKVFIDLN
ncbi:MAG: hypothetical protein LBJ36_03645 [Synergistaceae bacterium]|nr:hypothetical protein [Synergistaceae bacterium]